MILRARTHHDVTRRSRLRRTPGLRALVQETRLNAADLVEPIFVAEQPEDAGPIESMPGVQRESLASIGARARAIADSGVRAVLLFGIPATKDACGSCASDGDGVIPRAIEVIKDVVPDLVVMTDVCLCQYTAHGHCGILNEDGIELEATLDALSRTALAHARAGADVIAPSAMLDGVVQTIRQTLDAHGFPDRAILAYAIKHASAFYGPFRDAADSAPSFGDRRAHQMDPANSREALREAAQDIAEGADAVMVKPGLPCLDLILRARDLGHPVAAYQVSGEYSMVAAAARTGWLDERAVALESLTALKRAGADIIITYWASRAAHWLREQST
ncbi:MAG: porphobilinogen synthase [Planctomycetota bacterium]